MQDDPFDSDRKRILVIDGYAFRGLGPLYVIDKIVQSASKRAKKPLLPCDLFDLIGGTSSGALIAILIGRLGLDCNQAIAEYKQLVKACCGENEVRFWRDVLAGRDADSSSYVAALLTMIAKYSPGDSNPAMLISGNSGNIKSTNTFAVVASADPDFSNRTLCIRSYQGPKSSPPGYQWTVAEVAQAASSTSFYLRPLLIDNKYGFRDSGFSGFNNPVNLLKSEQKILWPNHDSNALILSLGTDAVSSVPEFVGKDWETWSITDGYSGQFIDDILTKLEGPTTSLQRRTATHIVQNILSTSAETRANHLQTEGMVLPRRMYHRIDPPLGLANVYLVDCFYGHSIRGAINSWAESSAGERIITAISTFIVDKAREVTADDLRKLDPPLPPEGTVNPGYHPQLDKRRPEDVMNYLKNYRVLFIVDDSKSMSGRLWDESREALSGIAEHALKFKCYRNQYWIPQFQKSFFWNRNTRGTPMEAIIARHLTNQLRNLNESVGLPEFSQVRPLDIIVLTDGRPDDEPKIPILAAVKEIKDKKHHPNCIGIQFVQIGNDTRAKVALADLAYSDEVGIVDTVLFESYAGSKMTPQVLERILLGGLHPNLRTLLREK